MDLKLKDKVALITGAGKGMGLAAAQAFAAEGVKVVVADVDAVLAERVTEQLRSDGHAAIGIRCNVSFEADVKAMVEETVAIFGSLDAAFNNAGVQNPAVETADADSDEFDRHIAINLKNQPNGRMGRPEEVASAVVWLYGAGARYVLGHALVVDGGLTVQ